MLIWLKLTLHPRRNSREVELRRGKRRKPLLLKKRLSKIKRSRLKKKQRN
jgi:hypothetical protein